MGTMHAGDAVGARGSCAAPPGVPNPTVLHRGRASFHTSLNTIPRRMLSQRRDPNLTLAQGEIQGFPFENLQEALIGTLT